LVPYEEQASINLIFKQLNDKANLLYKFVMLYSGFVAENQDYGTGELINMVEVHTLTAIEENPGINISELANMWARTKGAASQTATKLENRGLIERRKLTGNAKSVLLFPTEKGIQLSQAHKRYDAVEVSKTLDELISIGCTAQEIDTFFKVVEKYIEILYD
jgi:DNA-binding MarR family transcriptional regulator